MRAHFIRATTTAIVVTLALAACGQDVEKSASDAPTEEATAEAPAATAAPADASGGDAAVPGQDAPPPGLGRQLVITSAMTIETADVGGAVLKLTSIAERNGGAVFSSDVSLTDQARGRVQLRVPPAKLGGVKGEIVALGKLVGQGQTTEDVTDQVVDVDARILSAKASVDRVRGFYDQAKTVKELTALEAELTTRQTALELLLAQQRSLKDRVGLATINVDLYEPEAAPAPKVEKNENVNAWTALKGGVKALGRGVNALLIAVAATLPFLALLAVLWIPGRWLVRRLRRNATTSKDARPNPPQPAPRPATFVDPVAGSARTMLPPPVLPPVTSADTATITSDEPDGTRAG